MKITACTPTPPGRVCISSVPSMNKVCIKSHNPHSSPYPATAASRSLRVHCHTPPRTMCNAVLPCRICYVVPHRAEACNSLQRMTKVSNEIGLYCIDRWRITIQRACFMHISCIILKVMPKSWGKIHCWSPQPKSWGTCLPRSPWLLRLWLQTSLARTQPVRPVSHTFSYYAQYSAH